MTPPGGPLTHTVLPLDLMGSTSERAASLPLSRDTWADAALEVLARGGPPAVAVEPLARELGVTKGSFYHHFDSREELIEAALARWEARGTEGLERLAGKSPEERLERLFLTAMDTATDPRSGQLPTHLAAHRDDARVGPVLARVTARRLDYLQDTWTAAGCSHEDAHQRALLAYTAYLGMVQLAASAPERVPRDEALSEYVAQLVRVLVRSPIDRR